jgi:hypothetical protein
MARRSFPTLELHVILCCKDIATRSLRFWLGWIIGGLLSLFAVLGIRLVLSSTAELFLLGLSVAAGPLIVHWVLRVSTNRGTWPPPRKRLLLWTVGSPVFALFTAANFYVLLYGVHMAIAQPSELQTSVTASVQEHLPWRSCSHWVFIKSAMYSFTKFCIADERAPQLKSGTPVLAHVSKSPIGFRIERISPLKANFSSSGRESA